MARHAEIRIDVDALRHNAAELVRVADGAEVCAVVKADGYGHGSCTAARAALDGGATWLAVALVEEGAVLRAAGIEAPVLVLSEPPADTMVEAHRLGLTPTLYSLPGVRSAADAAAGSPRPWSVHLKVDTGMHRVGALPDHAPKVAAAIAAAPGLEHAGTFTHLALADEPDRPGTAEQLARFDRVLDALRSAGMPPGVVHAANSAGLLAHPDSRRDLVRPGISLYGIAPSPEVQATLTGVGPGPPVVSLRPAMSVVAEVTLVKQLGPGAGVSYGHRHVFARPATTAVVPLGYADGVPRRLGLTGGSVLIGGVARPIRGVVTMDQLVVEVTDGPAVAPGDEVVLLGEQLGAVIGAQDWADRLDTIAYEVVCGFSARLPRRSVGAAP